MGGPGPWTERWLIWLGYHCFRLFFHYFAPMRIVGMENIPPGGGVIFLSNHISALDVFAVPCAIYSKCPQERLRQAGKEELFRIPLVGWLLRKWRGFPVRRGGADLSSIRLIENYVRREKVVLYPEGTRSPDGRLLPGNRMVGRIVRDTKPVVVPVAVKGTDQVMPVGKILPRWGARFEVIFGAPLDLREEYAIENVKESSARIVEKVMQAIADLLKGSGVAGASGVAALEVKG